MHKPSESTVMTHCRSSLARKSKSVQRNHLCWIKSLWGCGQFSVEPQSVQVHRHGLSDFHMLFSDDPVPWRTEKWLQCHPTLPNPPPSAQNTQSGNPDSIQLPALDLPFLWTSLDLSLPQCSHLSNGHNSIDFYLLHNIVMESYQERIWKHFTA